MRPEDTRALLNPDERQVYDTLLRTAEARWHEMRLSLSTSSQVRRPEEPRVPRRPAGDRMNTNGVRRETAPPSHR